MGEFYKMEFDAWDEGTVELTLDEEAAYLRVCHQIYRRHGPIPDSERLLSSLWRCHVNRVRALRRRLIEKGKIFLTEDGRLSNERATQELDARHTIAARKGHTPRLSRDSSHKPLKSLDLENPKNVEGAHKRRVEKESPPTPPSGEIAFSDFWTKWPNADADARSPAEEAWAALGDTDRLAAIAGINRYIAGCARLKRSPRGAKRYLAEHMWGETAPPSPGLLIDHTWPNWQAWKAYAPQRKNDIGVSRLERLMAFCEGVRPGAAEVAVDADWPPDYVPSDAEAAALAVRKAEAMPKRRIA